MLEKQRQEIDKIDQQLVQLLEKRWAVVEEIQAIKQQAQLTVLDAKRESAVLEKVGSYVQNEAYTESIQAVFQAMMDVSKDYQAKK